MIRPKSAIKRYGTLGNDIKRKMELGKRRNKMKRKNVNRSKRQKQQTYKLKEDQKIKRSRPKMLGGGKVNPQPNC